MNKFIGLFLLFLTIAACKKGEIVPSECDPMLTEGPIYLSTTRYLKFQLLDSTGTVLNLSGYEDSIVFISNQVYSYVDTSSNAIHVEFSAYGVTYAEIQTPFGENQSITTELINFPYPLIDGCSTGARYEIGTIIQNYTDTIFTFYKPSAPQAFYYYPPILMTVN